MINRTLKHLDVDISINSPLWKAPISKNKLKKICSFTLNKLNLYQNVAAIELSVRLTDDAEIQIYNARCRNKNYPTNVLSFPTPSVHPERSRIAAKSKGERLHVHLGDIMLAFETIAREANKQGKNFDDHVTHLFVHSVLHLLDFTHDKKKDRDIMEKLEIEILKAFNIESPYE